MAGSTERSGSPPLVPLRGRSPFVPLRGNPFVGPRPLEAGERLWGRDREVRELDDELSSQRVVLLCSPSGAGKSSLIQAGLVPRVRASFDVWGPTRVNRETTVDGANRYALSAMTGFEEGVPERLRRPLAVLAGQTLFDYLEARPRRRSAPRNLLLVFDQFEEVLTVDPLAVEAKREFFGQLGRLLRNRRVWALFVLREDYLVPLDPYALQVPTHLKNRYRIDFLGLDAAREAMVNPARQAGRGFPAAEQLACDLATRQVQQPDGSFVRQSGQHVEPVQLQVVCRRLWDALPVDETSIDAEDLEKFGNVNLALSDYYAESIARIAGGDEALERAVREWFGERLISAGGIRMQVLRGTQISGGLANELIEKLLDTHLVRAEQRAGATWYELAHDRLVEVVQCDNLGWLEEHLSEVQRRAGVWEHQNRPPGLLLADEKLAAAERWAAETPVITDVEQRFLDASRQAQAVRERERRQARRIRHLAVVASVFGLVAGVLGLFAWTGWRAAEDQRAAAEDQRAAAENLTRATVAANLLKQGRTTEGNLLVLEVLQPGDTATALDALHQALVNPVEAVVLEGHKADVAMAAWSADGSRVLTASSDGTARVWDAATGEVTALEGHTDEVWAAAWSGDGRRVATASYDRTARIWDATGAERAVLAGHKEAVLAVAWNGDSTRLATASKDQTVRVWAATGAELAVLRPPESVDPVGDSLSVAWSPDGRRLATHLGPVAYVWEPTAGTVSPPLGPPRGTVSAVEVPVTVLRGHTGYVLALAWSADSTRLATAAADATVRIWDGATGDGTATLEGHLDQVVSVAWSGDGTRLVTASNDRTARVWSSVSGEGLAVLAGHTALLWSARWSGDGAWVATSSDDKTVRVWKPEGGEAVAVLAGHTRQVLTAEWDPSGERLLTASADHTARIWRPWETGEEVAVLRGHGDMVNAAAWSGDGRRVVTASDDATARVWDLPAGDEALRLAGHEAEIRDVAWSDDGRQVATGSWDHTARVWDTATGEVSAVLTGHTHGVQDVAWSGDGTRLATASWDHTAGIWDAASGERLYRLQHKEKVQTVAWSDDGRRLLTASLDMTAAIWDAATGERLAVLAEHKDTVHAASWSGDGGRVLTISYDDTGRIWDATTGETTAVLEGHEANLMAAAWSPDSTRVLTASDDRTARVWDAATGESLVVLAGHPDALTSVAWSGDGTRVATATWDGTVLLWHAGTGDRIASLEGHRAPVWTLAWSADGRRVLTASDDATARIWAVSERYPDYLRGRVRARLLRCLEPDVYQDRLGLDEDVARRRHDACEACVPRFFERLDGASPWEWEAYEGAWTVYAGCFFGRIGG